MNPTTEQSKINYLLKEGKDIKVAALAGTGKSTTLRYLAKANPNKTFLSMCFNAANAEESNNHPEKPGNIFYSTVHSLAYGVIMSDKSMKAKLGRWLDFDDIPDEQLFKLVSYLTKDNSPAFKKRTLCSKMIQQLIIKFCQSDYYSKDFPKLIREYFTPKVIEDNFLEPDESFYTTMEEIVKAYWDRLIDPGYPDKITHDVYLKIFQLRDYKIQSFWSQKFKRYLTPEILCLDEFQDANPVIEAIVRNQDHLQRIIVGDDNQQLYAWRGAGNALSNFEDFEVCSLTETFRSCQDIVDKANIVLQYGSDLQMQTKVEKKEVVKKAYLSRTNAESLKKALEFIEAGKSIYIGLDFEDIFSKLWHISALTFGQQPKYPDKDMLKIMDKAALQKAIAINDEIAIYTKLLPLLIQLYGNLTHAKEVLKGTVDTSAEWTLSTIHKSKGLEWDYVEIAKDFFREYDSETDTIELDDMAICKRLESEEDVRCLLYVAVTRAKYDVKVPSYLEFLFEKI